jgi:hypothetical protein
MMSSLRSLCLRLPLALAVTLAMILAVILGTALPVAAHGGGKQQVAGEVLGPFRVYVWTSPEPWRVGEAHTTVAVTRLLEGEEETPATGVQVFVVYVQDGQSERVAALEQTGAQAGFYEADGQVATAGEWQVTVEIAGPEGGGKVSFVEAVQPANAFNWWLIGGGTLVLLLAVGYLGTRKTGVRPVQRGASS